MTEREKQELKEIRKIARRIKKKESKGKKK